VKNIIPLEIAFPIILLILSILLPKIFSKIGDKIRLTIKNKMQYARLEKNAVILSPFPIVKSPKGYIYFLDNKKKLYCGQCYVSPSNLTPLEKTGFKKYICPACKTVYKA
jgi:hypothetical protein